MSDSSKPPMMKCGHAANATTEKDGKTIPCCAICIGINGGAETIDISPPDLTGRIATCNGHNPKPSSTGLAFFTHRPNEKTDDYYCGCHGWD